VSRGFTNRPDLSILWLAVSAVPMAVWLSGVIPRYHREPPRRLRSIWLVSSAAWAAVILLALWHREVSWATGLGFGVTVPAIGALMAIDLTEHRLPRHISYATLIILFPLLALSQLVGLLAGGLGMVAAVGVLVLVTRGSMGIGDLHFAPLLGVMVGWFDPRQVVIAILVAVVAGGIVAAGMLISTPGRSGQMMPFGPFLTLGVAIAILRSS
jgi:prepilin signal peptidase PulO-like enzyme (type II secretory pathway)